MARFPSRLPLTRGATLARTRTPLRFPIANFSESSKGEVPRTGAVHGGAFGRNLSGGKRHEEVGVLASESPERLEQLRGRFLRALSDLSGGSDEGKPAMISEVAKDAGLDPEGDPEDRALSERLAAELVEVGYASAEAGSGGFLAITPEGERAIGGAAG